MRTFGQKYETSIAPDPNVLFVHVRRDDGGIVNESDALAELLNDFYDIIFHSDVSGVGIITLISRTCNLSAIVCVSWSLVAN